MSRQGTQAHRLRALGKATLIIACWLVVWQLLAMLVDNRWLVCGPADALASWAELAVTSSFWFAIACSLGRIALGFLVAFVAGVLLGYAGAKLPLLRDFIKPLVTVVKSAPVVCIIALLLVGTGASAATSIVVVLVVFPQFYHAVLENIGARDEQLDAVLDVFGVSPWRKALFVEFVSLGTVLRATCAIAAGLAWKSGVAAELIGLPAMSIGTGVYLAKISLDSATIIAWTATVILLSWLSEKLLLLVMDLLLRLPKHALASRARRALEATEGVNVESERSAGCAVAIEELVRTFDVTDEGESPCALIYRDMKIAPGARVCLIAPSGTGKTTLLRMIAGIDEADEGEVSLPPDSTMSIVLQDGTLVPWATPLENIALVACDDDEIRRGYQDLLQVFDAVDLAKTASALSGGMKRRVELCRALAHRSQMVLADEPFSGIDEEMKKRCIHLIDQRIQGRTLILATHDESDAELLGARIIRL